MAEWPSLFDMGVPTDPAAKPLCHSLIAMVPCKIPSFAGMLLVGQRIRM